MGLKSLNTNLTNSLFSFYWGFLSEFSIINFVYSFTCFSKLPIFSSFSGEFSLNKKDISYLNSLLIYKKTNYLNIQLYSYFFHFKFFLQI